MQNVVNALLNMILVSVSEELFLVAMTLVFLERFDLLDKRMWMQNLKLLAIPVLPMAFLINLFKYIVLINKNISSIICLAVFYGLICLICGRDFISQHYKKIAFSMVGSFMILGALEITYPILAWMLDYPINDLKNNIWHNFLISLPSRVIGFSIVIYMIVKNSRPIKIRIFDIIIKNKFLYTSILTFCIVSIFLTVYVVKLISYNNILDHLTLLERILSCVSIMITPVIILFWVLMLVNYILVKEKQIQQTYENLIIKDDVTADVENQI